MELENRHQELCKEKNVIKKFKNQSECERNELNEKIKCIESENEKLLCENRTINERLSNTQIQNDLLKSQLKEMEVKFEKLENGLRETISCDPNKHRSNEIRADLFVK